MKRNLAWFTPHRKTKESKQQKGGEHPPPRRPPADELSPLHHDIRLDYGQLASRTARGLPLLEVAANRPVRRSQSDCGAATALPLLPASRDAAWCLPTQRRESAGASLEALAPHPAAGASKTLDEWRAQWSSSMKIGWVSNHVCLSSGMGAC